MPEGTDKPTGIVQNKLAVLSSLISTIIAILTAIVTFYDKTHEALKKFANVEPVTGIVIVVIAVGIAVWFAILGFSKRSALLRPERFLIDRTDPRFLKGREQEIDNLSSLCERHNLVFLEGESGSGKTSLARAGLVPACRDRGRLQPFYLDLTGQRWESDMRLWISSEAWHQLNTLERATLGFEKPFPRESFELSMNQIREKLGRTPLLIFDQLDDYQTAYQARFRDSGRWRKCQEILESNDSWNLLSQLLTKEAIHCLFITRTDLAGGLTSFRWTTEETFRLGRLNTNLAAPLLEQITEVSATDKPVVLNPEAGWTRLKHRLLQDLAGDTNLILPIQITVSLQALRQLPRLTTREYECHGGLLGLERLHIENNIADVAGASGLTTPTVLKLLLSLCDPNKSQVFQLTGPKLAEVIGAPSATPDTPQAATLTALKMLEDRSIVRQTLADTVDTSTAEPVWVLTHDFLSRGIKAAELHANFWQRSMEAAHLRFESASSLTARWNALLPIRFQATLLIQFLLGKLSYGRHLGYALLSLVRIVPLVAVASFLIFIPVLISGLNQDSTADHLFAEVGRGQDPSPEELTAIYQIAAGSDSLRFAVLKKTFSTDQTAERALIRAEVLLHACLQTDIRHKMRERLEREIISGAIANGSTNHSRQALAALFAHCTSIPALRSTQNLIRSLRDLNRGQGIIMAGIIQGLESAPDLSQSELEFLCERIHTELNSRSEGEEATAQLINSFKKLALRLEQENAEAFTAKIITTAVNTDFRSSDLLNKEIKILAPKIRANAAFFLCKQLLNTNLLSNRNINAGFAIQTLTTLLDRLGPQDCLPIFEDLTSAAAPSPLTGLSPNVQDPIFSKCLSQIAPNLAAKPVADLLDNLESTTKLTEQSTDRSKRPLMLLAAQWISPLAHLAPYHTTTQTKRFETLVTNLISQLGPEALHTIWCPALLEQGPEGVRQLYFGEFTNCSQKATPDTIFLSEYEPLFGKLNESQAQRVMQTHVAWIETEREQWVMKEKYLSNLVSILSPPARDEFAQRIVNYVLAAGQTNFIGLASGQTLRTMSSQVSQAKRKALILQLVLGLHMKSKNTLEIINVTTALAADTADINSTLQELTKKLIEWQEIAFVEQPAILLKALDENTLLDLLNDPFCVGGWSELVLQALSAKTGWTNTHNSWDCMEWISANRPNVKFEGKTRPVGGPGFFRLTRDIE